MSERPCRVLFARSAAKELEALDPPLLPRVLRKVQSLATDPRPPGCKKIAGTSSSWRIRVGDYRVVYEVDDHERAVTILVVRHRSAAYG